MRHKHKWELVSGSVTDEIYAACSIDGCLGLMTAKQVERRLNRRKRRATKARRVRPDGDAGMPR